MGGHSVLPLELPKLDIPKVFFKVINSTPYSYSTDPSAAPTVLDQSNKHLVNYGYNSSIPWKLPASYIRWVQPAEDELDRRCEYDMDEQDQEWLNGINADRKRNGYEPVTCEFFEIAMDRLEKEWFTLNRKLLKPDANMMTSEDSRCAICEDGDTENSNAIVFCDGCNLAVHQDCYGVPYIPEGQWLCRKCTVSPDRPVTCELCPNSYGAFKQTCENQWAHLVCAIHIPETGVGNAMYMEPIDGVRCIPKQRWKLKCYICKKSTGACIQCANRTCCTAYHVTCAQESGLYLKIKPAGSANPTSSSQGQNEAANGHSHHERIAPEGISSSRSFCDKHTPKGHIEALQAAAEARAAALKTEVETDSQQITMSKPSESCSEHDGQSPQKPCKSHLLTAPPKKLNSLEDLRALKQLATGSHTSKSARAYRKTYSIGPPLVPELIFQRVLEYLGKLRCAHKKVVLNMICKYWSLKREFRRGAPLLKRLHLEPWTATNPASPQNEQDRRRKYGLMVGVHHDLQQVKNLAAMICKREKVKLRKAEVQKQMIEKTLFPLYQSMQRVLKIVIDADKQKYFLNPVLASDVPDYHDIIKYPMDWSTIQRKIEAFEYFKLSEFISDIRMTLTNARIYNQPATSYHKAAIRVGKAIEPLLRDLISTEPSSAIAGPSSTPFPNSQQRSHFLEVASLLLPGCIDELLDAAPTAASYSQPYTDVLQSRLTKRLKQDLPRSPIRSFAPTPRVARASQAQAVFSVGKPEQLSEKSKEKAPCNQFLKEHAPASTGAESMEPGPAIVSSVVGMTPKARAKPPAHKITPGLSGMARPASLSSVPLPQSIAAPTTSTPHTPAEKPDKKKRRRISSDNTGSATSEVRVKKTYNRKKPPEQLEEEALIELQNPHANKNQLRSLKLRALHAGRIAERERNMTEAEKARRRRFREYSRQKREKERMELGKPQLLLGDTVQLGKIGRSQSQPDAPQLTSAYSEAQNGDGFASSSKHTRSKSEDATHAQIDDLDHPIVWQQDWAITDAITSNEIDSLDPGSADFFLDFGSRNMPVQNELVQPGQQSSYLEFDDLNPPMLPLESRDLARDPIVHAALQEPGDVVPSTSNQQDTSPTTSATEELTINLDVQMSDCSSPTSSGAREDKQVDSQCAIAAPAIRSRLESQPSQLDFHEIVDEHGPTAVSDRCTPKSHLSAINERADIPGPGFSSVSNSPSQTPLDFSHVKTLIQQTDQGQTVNEGAPAEEMEIDVALVESVDAPSLQLSPASPFAAPKTGLVEDPDTVGQEERVYMEEMTAHEAPASVAPSPMALDNSEDPEVPVAEKPVQAGCGSWTADVHTYSDEHPIVIEVVDQSLPTLDNPEEVATGLGGKDMTMEPTDDQTSTTAPEMEETSSGDGVAAEAVILPGFTDQGATDEGEGHDLGIREMDIDDIEAPSELRDASPAMSIPISQTGGTHLGVSKSTQNVLDAAQVAADIAGEGNGPTDIQIPMDDSELPRQTCDEDLIISQASKDALVQNAVECLVAAENLDDTPAADPTLTTHSLSDDPLLQDTEAKGPTEMGGLSDPVEHSMNVFVKPQKKSPPKKSRIKVKQLLPPLETIKPQHVEPKTPANVSPKPVSRTAGPKLRLILDNSSRKANTSNEPDINTLAKESNNDEGTSNQFNSKVEREKHKSKAHKSSGHVGTPEFVTNLPGDKDSFRLFNTGFILPEGTRRHAAAVASNQNDAPIADLNSARSSAAEPPASPCTKHKHRKSRTSGHESRPSSPSAKPIRLTLHNSRADEEKHLAGPNPRLVFTRSSPQASTWQENKASPSAVHAFPPPVVEDGSSELSDVSSPASHDQKGPIQVVPSNSVDIDAGPIKALTSRCTTSGEAETPVQRLTAEPPAKPIASISKSQATSKKVKKTRAQQQEDLEVDSRGFVIYPKAAQKSAKHPVHPLAQLAFRRLSQDTSLPNEGVIEDGTLVWAKVPGHNWFPAEVGLPTDSMVPRPVLDKLAHGKLENHLLVMFFDHQHSWQWIPRRNTRYFGESAELDSLLASEAFVANKSKLDEIKNGCAIALANIALPEDVDAEQEKQAQPNSPQESSKAGGRVGERCQTKSPMRPKLGEDSTLRDAQLKDSSDATDSGLARKAKHGNGLEVRQEESGDLTESEDEVIFKRKKRRTRPVAM